MIKICCSRCESNKISLEPFASIGTGENDDEVDGDGEEEENGKGDGDGEDDDERPRISGSSVRSDK